MDIATLKKYVDAYIKANGNREITGDILNDVLNEIIDSLNALDIQTYKSETQPNIDKAGSLWYKPSAYTLSRYNGTIWEVLDLSGSVSAIFTDTEFAIKQDSADPNRLTFNLEDSVSDVELKPTESGEILTNHRQADTYLNNLVVEGSIFQQGAAYETHAEKLYTTKDLIITREGALMALPYGEVSGIKALKYDGVTDGIIGITASGVAVVGDVGDVQPLACRETTPNSLGITYWHPAYNRLVTDANFKFVSGKLGVGSGDPSEVLTVGGDALIGVTGEPCKLKFKNYLGLSDTVLEYTDGQVRINYADDSNFDVGVYGEEPSLSVKANGKIEAPKSVNTLTAGSTVAISFTDWSIKKLDLTSDTTLTITGDYKTDDLVSVRVKGDYLLKLDIANFDFTASMHTDGTLKNYIGNSSTYQLVQIWCTDADNDEFTVTVTNLN